MNLAHAISHLGRSLTEALFPASCEVCGNSLVEGEEMICLSCHHEMPRTHIHNDRFNAIHQRLASPGIPIDRAAAYFYYLRDTPYARLIQKAKYNGRPVIARSLGAMFAREIMADGFFEGIDSLIPMPLHALKRLKRGYNQTEEICLGISDVTKLQIADNLHVRRHSSQTRKSAYQRLINVSGIMSVTHPEELEGKHLLIVDDVITTGATMLTAAATLIGNVKDVTVSVLSIGLTRLG